MEYFISESERKASHSTCYFEFQQGKFRWKHWLVNSLFLHADIFEAMRLFELFSKSIPDFNYYGPTNVDKPQWDAIVKNSLENENWRAIIAELTPWVDACFEKHQYFAICGI